MRSGWEENEPMKRAWVRRLARVTAALGLLWVVATAALFMVMRQPPRVAGKALNALPGPLFMFFPMETMWCEARKGALALGQEAPDFTLRLRDATGTVQLSSFRGSQPVVLVFGSYT
jgi:hypothetical protein